MYADRRLAAPAEIKTAMGGVSRCLSRQPSRHLTLGPLKVPPLILCRLMTKRPLGFAALEPVIRLNLFAP